MVLLKIDIIITKIILPHQVNIEIIKLLLSMILTGLVWLSMMTMNASLEAIQRIKCYSYLKTQILPRVGLIPAKYI